MIRRMGLEGKGGAMKETRRARLAGEPLSIPSLYWVEVLVRRRRRVAAVRPAYVCWGVMETSVSLYLLWCDCKSLICRRRPGWLSRDEERVWRTPAEWGVDVFVRVGGDVREVAAVGGGGGEEGESTSMAMN